jgi:hypothetical protein
MVVLSIESAPHAWIGYKITAAAVLLAVVEVERSMGKHIPQQKTVVASLFSLLTHL